MRLILAGVVLVILLGSLVPGLRRSPRARSAALVAIGVAVMFEGVTGLDSGWSWLDFAIVAIGAGVAAVNIQRYRLASTRHWRS